MNNNKKAVKCVVWDLDNTVWQGILAENDNLVLRKGVRDIIETLDSRGILNSIASRNNFDEAVKKLEMFALREFFVYPQITWNNKSESIKSIQASLNIGYDTIAFVDDQEFELAEVKSVYPEVHCFHIDDFSNILENDKFKGVENGEGQTRRIMYQTEEKRSQEETKFSNNVEFLRSLNLNLNIKTATEEDLARIHELTIRTNQLNATGYTYSREELTDLLYSPKHKIYIAELEDKFGQYGKIGVTLLEYDENVLIVKLLLISCRVMSRGIGNTLLSFIINCGISDNKKVRAEFLPNSRNNLMYVTYKFANFKEIDKLGETGVLMEYVGPATPREYAEYLNLTID